MTKWLHPRQMIFKISTAFNALNENNFKLHISKMNESDNSKFIKS